MASILALVVALIMQPAIADTGATQARIERDIARGNPVVVHVSVALADNDNQWIVPVPESIGDGQNPRNNLYWGARYGTKNYLIKTAGWEQLKVQSTPQENILERIILYKEMTRGGRKVPVFLVADAWDGRFIKDTIRQFLRFSAGHDRLDLALDDDVVIQAGGTSHLKVYIGHNALMDYFGLKDKIIANPTTEVNSPDSDAIVLACKSKAYFKSRLEYLGANTLLVTTGLMAPEAYSLEAAITAWVKGVDGNDVRRAAAAAYAKYQNINLRAAERLFGAGS